MTPEQDPRVFMAAERTLLAWIRTGLALMGFGFVVARFGLFLRELAAVRTADDALAGQSPGWSLWFGILLVGVGAIVSAAAAVNHARVIRALRRGDIDPSTRSSMAVALGVLLALIGVAIVGYLLVAR